MSVTVNRCYPNDIRAMTAGVECGVERLIESFQDALNRPASPRLTALTPTYTFPYTRLDKNVMWQCKTDEDKLEHVRGRWTKFQKVRYKNDTDVKHPLEKYEVEGRKMRVW